MISAVSTPAPAAPPIRWDAGLALAAGVALFAPAVLRFLGDVHNRETALYLWATAMVALWRDRGAGFTGRFLGLGRWRDVTAGCALAAAATAFYAALMTGSTSVARFAMVGSVAALSLGSFACWSSGRCAVFALFLAVCFGMPASAYASLTGAFRSIFVAMLELPPAIGLLDYRVENSTLVYPHYSLEIVDDCSGFSQLLAFVGLAFLGSFLGRPNLRRTVLSFAAAVLLAVLANGFRLAVFSSLVAVGWTAPIDEPLLHELAGALCYLPFVGALVVWLMRSHVPRGVAPRRRMAGAGWSLLWPAVVLAVVWALVPAPEPPPSESPAHFIGIQSPPGHELAAIARTETSERQVYGTDLLINRRFVSTHGGGEFELFAYATRSRGHLNVHRISRCLEKRGETLEYGPVVEAGGRRFWSFQLLGGEQPWHGYYAFHVEGEDRDDSMGTQWDVFRRRLAGGAPEVGLTRFLMPGSLTFPIPDEDRRLLEWRAQHLAADRP